MKELIEEAVSLLPDEPTVSCVKICMSFVVVRSPVISTDEAKIADVNQRQGSLF